jgi:hypothetical protein
LGGRISNFHWTRRTISRRGLGGVPRERGISYVLWKEKEEKESMEKILVLMWENVLFIKRKKCANKSMEGNYV